MGTQRRADHDVRKVGALQPTGTPKEIDVRGLTKSYGPRTVVDHVSLNVRGGEVVGLLGPNGAGKTTTFYMVVGLVR
ncbi:MAG TPA: ATP-binding cassette domain-containing protein, partial [Candidatus Eremiobacteraceae bacterium]|nr:ATP-binding cassette domain-containing protein [Candidatus Eremiobacteraceae bacterium]